MDLISRRRLTTVLCSLALSLTLGGCGTTTGTPIAQLPATEKYALTIDDRSSWGTLQILIGDTVVGSVNCDESVMVTPGDPGVPPLPWTVLLVTVSGATVDQRTEDGLAGPRWLIVFDTQVGEGSSPAVGPAPPCAFASPGFEPLPTPGLTSAAAIELGRKLVASRSAGPIAIESATIGRLAAYATVPGIDPQTPVWALIFSGSFADPSTCLASPPATPCPSLAKALVVLDLATGAELALLVPPPGD